MSQDVFQAHLKGVLGQMGTILIWAHSRKYKKAVNLDQQQNYQLYLIYKKLLRSRVLRKQFDWLYRQLQLLDLQSVDKQCFISQEHYGNLTAHWHTVLKMIFSK